MMVTQMTDEDRLKFIGWLEQQVVSGEIMVEQFERIELPVALIAREKSELLAAKVILAKLRSTEMDSVGGAK